MKSVRVWNQTRAAVLCERGAVADNFFTRLRGLLGRSTLPPDEGLLLAPCPSIHMFGMKFPLDIIFLTRENRVTDFVENIAPGKYYVAQPQCGKAHSALEVVSGTVARTSTQRGDDIVLVEIGSALS